MTTAAPVTAPKKKGVPAFVGVALGLVGLVMYGGGHRTFSVEMAGILAMLAGATIAVVGMVNRR